MFLPWEWQREGWSPGEGFGRKAASATSWSPSSRDMHQQSRNLMLMLPRPLPSPLSSVLPGWQWPALWWSCAGGDGVDASCPCPLVQVWGQQAGGEVSVLASSALLVLLALAWVQKWAPTCRHLFWCWCGGHGGMGSRCGCWCWAGLHCCNFGPWWYWHSVWAWVQVQV